MAVTQGIKGRWQFTDGFTIGNHGNSPAHIYGPSQDVSGNNLDLAAPKGMLVIEYQGTSHQLYLFFETQNYDTLNSVLYIEWNGGSFITNAAAVISDDNVCFGLSDESGLYSIPQSSHIIVTLADPGQIFGAVLYESSVVGERLDFGVVEGINLFLTRKFAYGSNTYYYLNRNSIGISDLGDRCTITEIDNLFNPGGHTSVTQEGNHDGTDDERSVVIGVFTLILPTLQELSNILTVVDNPLYVDSFYPEEDYLSADHYLVNRTSSNLTIDHTTSAYVILQVNQIGDIFNLGEHSGLNLNLILPSTQNGKHYRFLDNSGNYRYDGTFAVDDAVNFDLLQDLLNNGGAVTPTQEGNHDGTDDERSVVIGGVTLILPTVQEIHSLETADYPLSLFWTANPNPDNTYQQFYASIAGNIQNIAFHDQPQNVIFQIIDIRPDVVILEPPPRVKNITLSRNFLLVSQTSSISIFFTAQVTGFTINNIAATNATLANFESRQNGQVYNVTLTPIDGIETQNNSVTITLTDVFDLNGVDFEYTTYTSNINYVIYTIPIPLGFEYDIINGLVRVNQDWPHQLPSPNQSSFEIKPKGSFKRTEMTSGVSRHRRISRNPPTQIRMSWDMSKSEFSLFEAFFVYELKEGADWFIMLYCSGVGYVKGKFRFINPLDPYTARAITSESFQVSAVLELEHKAILSRSDFALKANITQSNTHIPIWLNALPAPLVQNYSIKPQSSFKRTSITSGSSENVFQNYDVPTIFTMSWNMTNEQFSLFQAFYQYNLNDGQSWFYMDHAEGIGFVRGEFRFIKPGEPYIARYLSHEYFQVNAELERRTKKLMYGDTYNIITCQDETIKDLVFDDAYNRLHIYLHETLPSSDGAW